MRGLFGFTSQRPKAVHIRVFIGGPKDARKERRRVVQVIRDDLPRHFKHIRFEPVMWDDSDDPQAFLVTEAPQDVLNRQLEISSCDVFLMVFRSRLGVPLQIDDKTYASGSAFEVEMALAAPVRHALAIFMHEDEPPVPEGTDKRAVKRWAEACDQYESMKAYFDQLVKEGHVKNINEYSDEATLATSAFNLLKRWAAEIDQRVQSETGDRPAARVPSASAAAADGRAQAYTESPFRGLASMRFEHHRVYFGREKQILELIERLRERYRAGFVCVHGPSGVGKSSFLMAGLLPSIIERGLITGGRDWQRLVMHPTEFGHPFASLATVLCADDGRRAGGLSYNQALAGLKRIVDLDGEQRVEAIDQVLVRPMLNGRPESSIVIVVVDQLEELFTAGTESQEDFLRLLQALSAHPRVAVYCTLRSDVLEEWNHNPVLAELMNDGILYGLLPPTTEQLRSMIVRPAREARIDIGELIEPLMEDAKELGDASLPMVAYALDVLYRHAPGATPLEKRLTFDAYKEKGHLKGLIQTHLEDTLRASGYSATTTPEKLDAILRERLFPALVGTRQKRPARRTVERSRLVEAGVPDQLIEALIRARVLTVAERGVVQLAHETLFRLWEPLTAWLRHHARLLETIAEVEEDAERWDEHGQNPTLIKLSRPRLRELKRELDIERADGAPAVESGRPPLSERAKAYIRAADETFLREQLIRSVKGGHTGAMVAAYEAGARLRPEDRSAEPDGLRDPFYHAVVGTWRPEGKSTDRHVEAMQETESTESVYNKDNIDHRTMRGLQPLHIAAALGHVDLVRHLLKMGADPRALAEDGSSVVSAAAFGGSLDVIRILVEEGVDPLVGEKDGAGPLLWAVQRGHSDIIDYLREKGADFAAATSGGYSVLSAAVSGARVELVRRIVAELPATLAPTKVGFTPLMHCCTDMPLAWRGEKGAFIAQRTEIAEFLLEMGIDAKASTTDFGWTAAHFAASERQVAMLRWLFAHGVDFDARDQFGRTPLYVAAEQAEEYLDVVECLLDLGATGAAVDVNATEVDGGTPLEVAVAQKHERIVERLLAAGARPDPTSSGRWGALHLAADDGSLPIVRMLLDAGADVSLQVPPGWTPLMLTMHHDPKRPRAPREAAARELLERGADPNIGVRHPLALAIERQSESMALLLLKHGADPALVPASEVHVLHEAAGLGYQTFVRQLLDRGIPINLADKRGHTPLAYALEMGRVKLAEFLIEHGAAIDLTHGDAFAPACAAANTNDAAGLELLSRKGARMEARSGNDGWTPLHMAAANGRTANCEWLLEHHHKLRDIPSTTGRSPLHLAAANGHADICERLLRAGAQTGIAASDKKKVLHYAALGASSACVDLLLPECRGQLGDADEMGWLPHHLVAQKDCPELLETFAAAGADLAAPTRGAENSALHIAAANGQARTCAWLLERRTVDVDVRNALKSTPLHFAATEGHADVCEVLLGAGADPAALDEHGMTALLRAVEGGHTECVRCLAPVSPLEVETREGQHTALHRAATLGNVEAIRILCAKGARRDARDWTRDTPLHLAVESGQAEAVSVLLEQGADPRLMNSWDETVADLAAGFRFATALDLLAAKAVYPRQMPTFRESDDLDFLAWTVPSSAITAAITAHAGALPVSLEGADVRIATPAFLNGAHIVAIEQPRPQIAREAFAIVSSDHAGFFPLDWTAQTFLPAMEAVGCTPTPDDAAMYAIFALFLMRKSTPLQPLTDFTLVRSPRHADPKVTQVLAEHQRPLVVDRQGADAIVLRGNFLFQTAILAGRATIYLHNQVVEQEGSTLNVTRGGVLCVSDELLVENLPVFLRCPPHY